MEFLTRVFFNFFNRYFQFFVYVFFYFFFFESSFSEISEISEINREKPLRGTSVTLMVKMYRKRSESESGGAKVDSSF